MGSCREYVGSLLESSKNRSKPNADSHCRTKNKKKNSNRFSQEHDRTIVFSKYFFTGVGKSLQGDLMNIQIKHFACEKDVHSYDKLKIKHFYS